MGSVMQIARRGVWGLALGLGGAFGAQAEDWRSSYTIFGTPGLIEMPSAGVAPDGEIGMTLGGFALQQRGSFTFQVAPRLSGTFRYSRFDEFTGPGTDDLFDRSFDIHYLLMDEGRFRPAFAIGLRDFLGTGLYSSEYVVATKTVTPDLRVTAGLGWGRMGTRNGFTNPLGVLDSGFEVRPFNDFGLGGNVAFDQYFRGDAAVFGGVEWRVAPDYTLKLEYSSDAYTEETADGTFAANSPFNVGLTYSPRPGYALSVYYLYGSEVGFSATTYFNPRGADYVSGLDVAPIPVAVRAQDRAAAASWDRTAEPAGEIRATLAEVLARDGIILDSTEITDQRMRVRYTNTRYRAEAQAIGRVARVLTQLAPASVDTFVLEPMQRGIAMSATTIQRGDMEDLENEPDAAWTSFARAQIGEAEGADGLVDVAPTEPTFLWGLTPYTEVALFDGDQPALADIGLELTGRYSIQPNLVLSGVLRLPVTGNRAAGVISPSTLPPVRREGAQYGDVGQIGIENLTLSYYGRPGEYLYSRITLGYLERMFGGVSGEVLWKPVESRLALGAELNYAMQRDFDMGFGFRDYDILMGHVSAYYDFGNGFQGQLDVGRYLAGDWGATVALDREFENGWRVGAYATLTDAPFDAFGEGSFDKGIRITIPTEALIGQPSRNDMTTNLSSLARDGGARLNVDGRLYEVVRDGHVGDLENGWGRFWR